MNRTGSRAILFTLLVSFVVLFAWTLESNEPDEPNEPEIEFPPASTVPSSSYEGAIYKDQDGHHYLCKNSKRIKLIEEPDKPAEPKHFEITCTILGCDGTCRICDPFNPQWAKERPEWEMLIPTWPDYIELKKDLVISTNEETIFAVDMWDGFHGGMGMSSVLKIPKGTKIYFENNQKGD